MGISGTSRPRGFAVVAAAAVLLAAGGARAADDYQHFKWTQAADGIWLGVTPPASFISGNSVIIDLGGHALVVDPHITEFTANEIIAKAREVAGPVKYLVNTHLHNDHTQGNSAFKKAFPGVTIIAHENTCWGITAKAAPRSRYRLGKLGRELDEVKANLPKVTDPKDRADLERVIAGNERYLEDAKTLQWVAPDVCLDLQPGQIHTINDGGREVRIGYYGRAHTAGDLVVYLPREKTIANGDLWMAGGMGSGGGRDGSVLETPRTLRAIAALDFDTVLPGHGDLFEGKDALNKSITSTEALIAKVKASYDAGDYVDRMLELVQPPARARGRTGYAQYVPYLTLASAEGWKRDYIRAYEEIELRNQLGLPPLP
jgi:glyoxylase-like metal-dependent hydrolase (beta-lactamase superfamily II)